MSNLRIWLRRAFNLLLVFYPAKFRAEFGVEMQAVFDEAMKDSQSRGYAQLCRSFWRELRSWPGSILQEHLRARREEMSMNGSYHEKPLLPQELLAAMIFFLLPLFSILFTTSFNLPEWTNIALVFIFWGCIIFSIGLAITRRLPRWSLSYLGFLLAVGVVLAGFDRLWGWIYPVFTQVFGPRSLWSLPVRIIYSGGFALGMISSILLGALILVSLLRLIPFTSVVWQHIRTDWTQLSFIVYGSLVFLILLAFEEYRHDEPWKFAAWMCLALGAWFYLRVKGQKQRIIALIGGATGAMWIVAIGTWELIPLQDWQSRYSLISMQDIQWTDTSSAVIGWIGIIGAMIAPALLNLWPNPQNSAPRAEPELK